MERSEILKKADDCVSGRRSIDYGTPEDNFSMIAKYWSAYKGVKFSPVDVANMMVLFKIGRVGTGQGTLDCFVDIAGYAACAGEIFSKKLPEAPEPKTAEGIRVQEEEKPAEAPKKTAQKKPGPKKIVKKPLDDGKMKALRQAGWSLDKIADEFSVSPQTVANHLNALADREEAEEAKDADNEKKPAEG